MVQFLLEMNQSVSFCPYVAPSPHGHWLGSPCSPSTCDKELAENTGHRPFPEVWPDYSPHAFKSPPDPPKASTPRPGLLPHTSHHTLHQALGRYQAWGYAHLFTDDGTEAHEADLSNL